jgi:hypothetical protein
VPEVREFLKQHAATLESVTIANEREVPFCLFPNLFPNLKKITTNILPQYDVTKNMPSLESVIMLSHYIKEQDLVSEFPLCRITEYGTSVLMDGKVHQKILLISQMTGLSVLSLDMRFRGDGSCNQVPDLFANMHKLERVSISCSDRGEPLIFPEAKSWPSSLFANNPHLREVILIGIPVTDDDLLLCSELVNLSKMQMRCDQDAGFTITGIRSLLRGASRSKIAYFSLTAGEDVVMKADWEFDKIAKERGIKFSSSKEYLLEENMDVIEEMEDLTGVFNRIAVTFSISPSL